MPSLYDEEFLAETQSRADTYALFAHLLRQEVTLPLLQQLRKMTEDLEPGPAAGEGLLLLGRYMRESERREDVHVLAELGADYAALFLNAGDRPVSPYESVYASTEKLLMQETQDQARQAYAAMGLAITVEGREPEDHLAYQLEFMSHLCLRAIAAQDATEETTLQMALEQQRHFLENHLLKWVPDFSEDLVRQAASDFYRALGLMIGEFLYLEKVELSVNL
jgi:putative dimethyl sulfoxide reductase chaperone